MSEQEIFTSKWNPIYLFLRFVLVLISWTPKSGVTLFGESVARLVPYLAKKDDGLIRKNVLRVMGLAPHSEFSRMFSVQVLRHQVLSLFETIKEVVSPGSIEVVGLEEYADTVEKATSLGQGVVIFTGHLGSWELVARYGAQVTGGSFHALAKPSKHSAFSKFLDDLRSLMRTKVLWTHKSGLLRDMMKVLKCNQLLGFVMDQKPDERVGHEVDFLGQKTIFVSGPARLALRSKAQAIGVFCVREAPWRYRIICEVVDVESDREEAETYLTQRMAEVIENQIKLYPEQWVWNYRRWPAHS